MIRMHYGLGKYKEHTKTELAKYYNLSDDRIGQILKKAIFKLQHVSSASLLLSTGFYDKFTKVDVNPAVMNEAEVYLQREKSILN
jgi:lantibiotic modifying enzyme